MLCKIRHQANETTLRSIYYAIFQSHLSHVCTAWDQNIKYNHQIRILQRKAMRIIFFSDFNEHTTPPLSKAKILRFIGFIQMENCIFVKNLFQVLCTLYQTNLKKLFVSYHPQCKKIYIYKSPERPVKGFFFTLFKLNIIFYLKCYLHHNCSVNLLTGILHSFMPLKNHCVLYPCFINFCFLLFLHRNSTQKQIKIWFCYAHK